jgi:serine/threonine-protein kinase RsbW
MPDTRKPTVDLSIPVIPDMELAATKTAEVVAKHMELGEEATAEISMALIEACLNAFEHSKTDEKNIYIHFVIDDETLTIKVEDKGIGFESEEVEIPDIDQKLKGQRKRGWGLQIIKELMDSVEWESSQAGTTVTMTKTKS